MTHDPDALVPLTTALNYFEAETIAQVLRAEDIPAFVQGYAATALNYAAPVFGSETAVQVRLRDLERARRILAANKQDSVDIDWSEVDVGEAVDPLTSAKARTHKAVQRGTFVFKWMMIVPLLIFWAGVIAVGFVRGIFAVHPVVAGVVIAVLTVLVVYAVARGTRR